MSENESQVASPQEPDYHAMWDGLGMNLADHDMLLGAVGQMYGEMFLSQENRPRPLPIWTSLP